MIDERLQGKVRALVDEQLATGAQIGVQVCVYKDGERVVDLWAGKMGPKDPRPVQPNTLFSSFSTTKGVAAAAVHILADKGLVDYDAPVAMYWPDFADQGKENVTVAIAMSHQAGLHAMPENATVEDIIDFERGLKWVAAMKPAWEPGTATGYHGLTYAWIAGGIVGGASGRHIKDVIREEIAEPLGIAEEMFVGIPDGVEDRLATLKPFDPTDSTGMPEMPPDHDFYKAMPSTLPVTLYDEMRVRKACIPSANGHFTARALAKMYAAFANGGEIDRVRLVSKARITEMSRILTEDMDRVIMMPIPKGVGFMMGGGRDGVAGVFGPRRTAFGHSGAGGSTAFADPERNLAMAVTINRMHMSLQGEGPTFDICDLVRRELGAA
jgi:CubicO group peptidase (beta-lactamase class C family)